ncbi:MAG: hypothetical protein MUE70_03680, partial [Desulfobacterales bacterium]|nr:hypothetical protein [Desulfobacterales bacterium]
MKSPLPNVILFKERNTSGLSPMQVSTLAVNDKNSDESQNEVISNGFNEFDDDSNVDPPNIATSQDSDNDQNNESCQISNRLISGISDDSNEPKKDNKICELNMLPEK